MATEPEIIPEDIMSVRTNRYLQDGTLRYRPYEEGAALRWLFVDDQGTTRSATAQTIAGKVNINARAVGIDMDQALVPASLQLVNWAQKIIFFEQSYYDKFLVVFRNYEGDLGNAKAKSVVLNTTATFYMDPALIYLLKEALPELGLPVIE